MTSLIKKCILLTSICYFSVSSLSFAMNPDEEEEHRYQIAIRDVNDFMNKEGNDTLHIKRKYSPPIDKVGLLTAKNNLTQARTPLGWFLQGEYAQIFMMHKANLDFDD